MKRKPIYQFFKRVFDWLGATVAILVFLIPMVIVAIAIKCDSKGPVFFTQKRVGKNKKLFRILKFRSMYANTDPNIPTPQFTGAASHVTHVGAFLRRTSIDELPQLFNIWLGQMSFVGPRPPLFNEYELVAERDKYHANDVLPGLTGWAQINGRDELSFHIALKAKFDGEYVEKRSLLFDLKIMFKTAFSVFRHDGIFDGSEAEAKKAEALSSSEEKEEESLIK